MAEPEQRKKSWWQFRLRSLLLVMLIVAAYFAGWSTAMRRVRQSEAEVRLQLQRASQAVQLARQQAYQRVATQANAANARIQTERTKLNELDVAESP